MPPTERLAASLAHVASPLCTHVLHVFIPPFYSLTPHASLTVTSAAVQQPPLKLIQPHST